MGKCLMTILSVNYNHPKPGDTIKVEPIRTLQAISKKIHTH